MSDQHDYLALDWVKGEIQETLNQAQQALEVYVENPDDSTRMRFCQTYLHQVVGTLQMVEFYGAALLAEEMEKLAAALLDGNVSQVEDAQETLMRGILQLPPYLDRIQESRRDQPLVLMPLLNDLRASRGESLLSETSLFKPNLEGAGGAGAVPDSVVSDPNFPALARKIRQMYQIALLGVIRSDNLPTNYSYMAKVFAKLRQVTGEAAMAPLWHISSAMVEAMASGGLQIGTSVKMVMGNVDKVLKLVVAEGVDVLSKAPPSDLLKNQLYYIAKASKVTPLVEQVRETYGLRDALPDEDALNEERARMSGPDQAAMGSVVQALSEELNKVKDALERFVHDEETDLSKLKAQGQELKQVADTVAVLGMGQARQLLTEQVDLLDDIASGQKPAERSVLMDVAGSLLYVEATLQGVSGDRKSSRGHGELAAVPDHVERARDAVIRESRAALEEAKEGIVEFIASQWQKDHLLPVPDKLTAVRGGLEVILLPRPALILRRSVEFIDEKLLIENAETPDWRQMDTLADAITSVEYYLERLTDDPDSGDQVLDVARESITRLGYGISDEDFGRSPSGDSVESTGAGVSALAEEISMTVPEIQDDQPVESNEVSEPEPAVVEQTVESDDVADAVASVADELLADAVEEQADDQPVEAPIEDTVEEVDIALDEIAVEPVAEEVVEPEPVVDAVPEPEPEEEDDLIDDEIIEIFVEEAGEVLEALDEYFPRWAANTGDEEALVEFRRAFHTLKGSGRMVGALIVGELAWSIENMMNRVIDKTITPTPILIDLVKTVHGIIPALVEAFQNRVKPPYDVQPLQDAANTLADGGSIDAIPDVTSGSAGQAAAEEVAAESEDVSAELDSQDTPEESAAESDDQIDPALLDVFLSEAESNLAMYQEWLDEIDPDLSENPVDDKVMRALHTIKGSARMTSLDDVSELAAVGEKFVKTLANASRPANRDAVQMLTDCHQLIQTKIQSLTDNPTKPMDGAEALIQSFEAALAELQGVDGGGVNEQSLANLLSADMNSVLASEFVLQRWLEAPQDNQEEMQSLHNELRGIAEQAKEAGIADVEELAGVLSRCAQAAADNQLSDNVQYVALANEGHDALICAMDYLAAGQSIVRDAGLIERLQALLSGGGPSGGSDEPGSDPEDDPSDGLSSDVADFAAGSAAGDELSEMTLDVADSDDDAILNVEESVASDAPVDIEDVPLQLDDDISADFLGELIDESESIADAEQTDFSSSEENALDSIELEAVELEPAELEPVELEAVEPEHIEQQQAEPPMDFNMAPPVVEEQPVAAAGPMELDLDPELLEIFLEEAEEVLENASNVLDSWQDGDASELPALQRDLHTLKGGAGMAGVSPIRDLSHELENLYEGFNNNQFEASDDLFTVLHACHDRLHSMVDEVRAEQRCTPAPELVAQINGFLSTGTLTAVAVAAPVAEATPAEPEDLSADRIADSGMEISEALNSMEEIVDTLSHEQAQESHEAAEAAVIPPAVPDTPPPAAPDRDEELVAIFLEEADEILESAGTSLESWMEVPDNLIEVQTLQRDLHTLKGGARMAEVPELGDLSHELENLYEGLALSNLQPTPVLFQLLHACHDRLAVMVEGVKANQGLHPANELIQAIHDYIENPEGFSAVPAADAVAQPAAAVEEQPAQVAAPAFALPPDVDPEILGIFIEESDELCESMDNHLTAWQADPADVSQGDALLRVLHTLKGGARLASLKELGDISHDFETSLEDVNLRKNPTPEFFTQMHVWQDKIHTLVQQLSQAAKQPAAAEQTQMQPVQAPKEETAPAAEKKQPPPTKKAQSQQPQETVRIDAGVLENLVNLAGETSINRGRVEQSITEFAGNIVEMGNTLERLYDQLRRLDVETEAQIMSNYQQGIESGEYGEDFDPLEMDQYSELHQITKQLSESASDLLDLRGSLLDRTRDTETLLLQQSRVNTELQETLMRTRMVPFSRLVPRLRRIVRQISGEINKKVDFQVINPEGELDRTLMERIVAPLEHMLRNAVDHGIEDAEGRAAAGKPEAGNVSLTLGREGGEVVLILQDDGKGIDTKVVLKKAIERGLVDDNAQLTEREIQQFIFSAGFSTAAKVTQISGRGVGMDVVASEIKQMGGTVLIESEVGKGTRFVVRLPFTLAMNRALMVKVSEENYAIPLDQIEGIVRITAYELQAFQQENPPPFKYAGREYEFAYLGGYVHGSKMPGHMLNSPSPLPVLLIRSSEHTVAVVVDGLVGSREVVVKSVGPQLSTVAGISGATILGDGSVVIILDIHSLIRADHVQRQHHAERLLLQPELAEVAPVEEEPEERKGPPLVMVTDDSVTVRKVTTRLLERNGYKVTTAKDGMDAIAKLEDIVPDVMLLDIEMPRMDGFEVATHVRHEPRLQDVPIIMITSRTGEKHRERAMAIGVNEYMGKPFQEGPLLETITKLLEQSGVTVD